MRAAPVWAKCGAGEHEPVSAFLVAIEGIDGSGKGTQSEKLRDHLQRTGRSVALLRFPRYGETLFGQAVAEFLNGRFGTLEQVHPFLASLLYAGDRFESKEYLRQAMAEHDVVVLDRYVPSNLAHQGAKLEGAERRELLQRIERIEYGLYGIPRADLILLLDVPADVAQRLIAGKKQRDYTDRAADLQEADGDYLHRVRQVYRQLAAAGGEWRRIDCLAGDQLRSIDDIAAEIAHIVVQHLPG